jgi:hypothetical protein
MPRQCLSWHAHVVATAVEAGGGTLLTGDDDGLERLAAAYRMSASPRCEADAGTQARSTVTTAL